MTYLTRFLLFISICEVQLVAPSASTAGVDPTAHSEPRAAPTSLQHGERYLQSLEEKPEGKFGTSANSLARLFQSPDGQRAGVDIGFMDINTVRDRALAHTIGMKRHVLEELLPTAEKTARELQGEIDGAMEALVNCSQLVWNSDNALRHREKILANDENKEYECLVHENAQNHKVSEVCAKVTAKLSILSEPTHIKELANKSYGKVLSTLSENLEYYRQQHDALSRLNDDCKKERDVAATQHKECEADKDIVGTFYCYMKAGQEKACSEYDRCFKGALDKYIEVKRKVLEFENINKAQFTDMACSSWVDGETLVPCVDNNADTAHLDISYPEEPVQTICGTIMMTRPEAMHFACKDADGAHMYDTVEKLSNDGRINIDSNSDLDSSNETHIATNARPAWCDAASECFRYKDREEHIFHFSAEMVKLCLKGDLQDSYIRSEWNSSHFFPKFTWSGILEECIFLRQCLGHHVDSPDLALHFEARGPNNTYTCIDAITSTFNEESCSCHADFYGQCDQLASSGFHPYSDEHCARALMCPKKECPDFTPYCNTPEVEAMELALFDTQNDTQTNHARVQESTDGKQPHFEFSDGPPPFARNTQEALHARAVSQTCRELYNAGMDVVLQGGKSSV